MNGRMGRIVETWGQTLDEMRNGDNLYAQQRAKNWDKGLAGRTKPRRTKRNK